MQTKWLIMLMAIVYLIVYSVPIVLMSKMNTIYAEISKNRDGLVMSCHIGTAIADQITKNEIVMMNHQPNFSSQTLF